MPGQAGVSGPLSVRQIPRGNRSWYFIGEFLHVDHDRLAVRAVAQTGRRFDRHLVPEIALERVDLMPWLVRFIAHLPNMSRIFVLINLGDLQDELLVGERVPLRIPGENRRVLHAVVPQIRRGRRPIVRIGANTVIVRAQGPTRAVAAPVVSSATDNVHHHGAPVASTLRVLRTHTNFIRLISLQIGKHERADLYPGNGPELPASVVEFHRVRQNIRAIRFRFIPSQCQHIYGR